MKLSKPSDEMRHLCSLLAEELRSWPDVTSRPLFGMLAIYRKKRIFALLPDKRSLGDPNTVGYKEAGKWKKLVPIDPSATSEVLEVLERAYRITGRRSSDSRE
jgi:hypothetical protein